MSRRTATTSLRPKPVIGLLGGIGSGKSLVASQLGALGCGVVDADGLCAQALDQEGVRCQLAAWWGPDVLREDGAVDRAAVGRIVFERPEELRRLEGLVHPVVMERREALHRRFQSDPDVVAIVEDCPLLIEKGLDRSCDVLIVVRSNRAARLARLARDRGWSEDELARREKNQIPLDTKIERADHVIDNNADPAACEERVCSVLSEILHEYRLNDPPTRGSPVG